MWKKTFPLIIFFGILLVGCTNNNTVPNNDNTPTNDVRDDEKQWIDNGEKDVEDQNLNNENADTNGNDNQAEIIEDFNRKNDVQE